VRGRLGSPDEKKRKVTSRISLENIEDYIFTEFRCSDPVKIRRFTSMIRAYAAAQVLRCDPGMLEDVPVVMDEFTHLAPGDYDANAEITRCARCGKAKDWQSFHLDAEDPSGHKTVCKSCRRGRPPKGNPPVQRHYICRLCRDRKPLDEFPPEKSLHRSIPMACLACRPKQERRTAS
jgi:hypothetical protein